MTENNGKGSVSLDDDTRLAMPAQELFERIGFCNNTGYKAIRDGEIPAFKIGRQYFIGLQTVRSLVGGG